MKFYLPRNLRVLEALGKEPLDGNAFNELTIANEIDVVLSPYLQKGGFYYYSPVRRHTIVISSRHTPDVRRWIGWHEFAHFLQNYWKPKTVAAGCELGKQSIKEKQANSFANIATIEGLRYREALEFVDVIMGGGIRNRR